MHWYEPARVAKLIVIRLAATMLAATAGLALSPLARAGEATATAAKPERYDTDRAACSRADSPGRLLLTPTRLTTAHVDCETTREDTAHTRKATCTRTSTDFTKVPVTYVLDPSSTNTLDITTTVGTAWPDTEIYYRCQGGRAAPLPYTPTPAPDIRKDSPQQADADLRADQIDPGPTRPPPQYGDARTRLFDEGATPMVLALKDEGCAASRFCARYPEALRCTKDKPAVGYLCIARWTLMTGETVDYFVETKTNTVRTHVCRANCAYDAVIADR